MKRSPHRFWEVAILLIAFIVINLLGAKFQKQISYDNGKGWEGVGYYQVAQEFIEGKPIAAEAPMVYRIGTPFLVSKIAPHNIFLGYKIVNTIANFLMLCLLIVWLRLHLHDWRVRTVLILLFLMQWDTPVRWLWFYPAHTDPWMWVFILSGLIAIHRYREGQNPRLWLAALCGLSAVGVIFREVVLAVPIVLLFVRNPLARRGAWQTLRRGDGSLWLDLNPKMRRPALMEFLPLVCALIVWIFVHRMATPTESFSFLHTAVQWLRSKSVITYLHGWMLAYGVIVFLPVFFWQQSWDFFKARQDFLVYVLFFALMGYVGGTDTERLLYWSMPVVIVLIGKLIEDNRAVLRSTPLLLFLGACQLISARTFLLTPDYTHGIESHSIPFFTPLRNAYFMDLFSFHGTPQVMRISLLEYLVFAGVLCLWLARRRAAVSWRVPGYAVIRAKSLRHNSAVNPSQ